MFKVMGMGEGDLPDTAAVLVRFLRIIASCSVFSFSSVAAVLIGVDGVVVALWSF